MQSLSLHSHHALRRLQSWGRPEIARRKRTARRPSRRWRAGAGARQRGGGPPARRPLHRPHLALQLGDRPLERLDGRLLRLLRPLALTAVTLPDSLTSIGHYAFYGCSALTAVSLPDSLTSIGDYAFSGCPLDAESAAAVRALNSDAM